MPKYKVLEAYGERVVGEVFEADEELGAPLVAEGKLEVVSDDSEVGQPAAESTDDASAETSEAE